MVPGRTLLSVLALATAAFASPIVIDESHVKVTLARHNIQQKSGYNVLEHDRARLATFKAKGAAKASVAERAASAAATNSVTYYSLAVGVGSPATTYDLIVDTGSSNTWVGASTQYKATRTSTDTRDKVAVSYGSGSMSGTEYTDTVTLGTGLTITKQSIGVASKTSGFEGVDGIVGIGPTDLTEDTVSGVTEVPTVTDNLYTQGTISEKVVGIYFQPPQGTSEAQINGELTFGGVDTTKTTSAITYTPLTTTEPASYYWGINQSITMGGTTIMATTAGIVDTGTTLLYLPEGTYNSYVSATGATLDENTGLLTVASESDLQSLYFTIGGTEYELTANAQIWPRDLNTLIGGTANKIYLVVASTGEAAGSGLDFINGYVFLERFYSVFDSTNNQVGFATTSYTDATSN
ncbi:family A1 protease [Dacryopinax primogenitus]|uniref:Family A1 protease n=1 Tax=Dacryopinax primogenitus (strain DJM 731) TaxID=1858805 RepID=M5GBE8_DACPD|nr:family A1 protease [Dacryopinax primogenitus]EJU06274.1 family A1 protease [Dacryopinax primogenitus]